MEVDILAVYLYVSNNYGLACAKTGSGEKELAAGEVAIIKKVAQEVHTLFAILATTAAQVIGKFNAAYLQGTITGMISTQ